MLTVRESYFKRRQRTGLLLATVHCLAQWCCKKDTARSMRRRHGAKLRRRRRLQLLRTTTMGMLLATVHRRAQWCCKKDIARSVRRHQGAKLPHCRRLQLLRMTPATQMTVRAQRLSKHVLTPLRRLSRTTFSRKHPLAPLQQLSSKISSRKYQPRSLQKTRTFRGSKTSAWSCSKNLSMTTATTRCSNSSASSRTRSC